MAIFVEADGQLKNGGESIDASKRTNHSSCGLHCLNAYNILGRC